MYHARLPRARIRVRDTKTASRRLRLSQSAPLLVSLIEIPHDKSEKREKNVLGRSIRNLSVDAMITAIAPRIRGKAGPVQCDAA